MATFYFTYGTSRQFPYQGGWTEVDAPSGRAAYAAFRAFHPDQTEGTLNCSDVYPERAFKATKMYAEGNFGARCHERITLLRECSEMSDMLQERSADSKGESNG